MRSNDAIRIWVLAVVLSSLSVSASCAFFGVDQCEKNEAECDDGVAMYCVYSDGEERYIWAKERCTAPEGHCVVFRENRRERRAICSLTPARIDACGGSENPRSGRACWNDMRVNCVEGYPITGIDCAARDQVCVDAACQDPIQE